MKNINNWTVGTEMTGGVPYQVDIDIACPASSHDVNVAFGLPGATAVRA